MNRGYLQIGVRRVHLFAGGRGPALLLLHSLPQGALELRALGAALSETNAVIIPDLAGCGLSDPLPADQREVEDFAADLAGVLDAFGVGACTVYARRNAAPIGLALGNRLRERAAGVVLDEPRFLDRGDADSYARHVSDVFTPEPSGAHLVRLWDRVRADWQFWPPHRERAQNRLLCDMPDATALTADALGWLRAGSHAIDALEAIARHAGRAERAADALTVRTLAPQADADSIREALAAFRARGSELDLRAWQAPRPRGPGLSRMFIPVRGGHLHAQVSFEGQARPVVALHDPAGTSELVMSFTRPMLPERPVIALDLPGNGESDNVLGTDEPTSATYARVVAEALDALGIGEVDLIGRYSGGPIGMELEFQRPGRVRHLVQAGITTYAPAEARRLLERYTPSIAPSDDGAHLLRAWHIMKSQALYWPWFDQSRDGIIRGEPQLDPALIHRRVVDLLKCGDLYRKAYAALWTYPLEERLPRLKIPTMLCAPAWDPLFPHLGKAAAAGPQCRVMTLPDRFADWPRSFIAFFEDRPA